MSENGAATLYILGDRGRTVDGSTADIRGRQVKDKNGDGVGKVAGLLIDEREEKVRFLLVEHGGFLGFGATTSLIPVDAVTKVTEDDVCVDQSREHVAAAPGYSPDLVDDQPYQSGFYSHYGLTPYWGGGYVYPGALTVPAMSPAMSPALSSPLSSLMASSPGPGRTRGGPRHRAGSPTTM